MPDMLKELTGLLLAGIGAVIGALVSQYFQRRTAAIQERTEIIETHFLQLQNCLESLCYRIENIRKRGGKQVMTDRYFRDTSVYAIGRVLAHETLLVSEGIYAKLNQDEHLKRELKTGFHRINRGMDDDRFQHYHRLQLAEMLLDGGRVLSYTEFLSRAGDTAFQPALAAAAAFVDSAEMERFEAIGVAATKVFRLLETHTRVPSALTLNASAR